MTAPFLQGTGIVEKKSERDWQTGGGWRTIRVFEGVEDAVLRLIPILQQTFNNIRVIPQDGPVMRIEATTDTPDDGSAEVAEETWELLPTESEKDFKATKQFLALTGQEQAEIILRMEQPGVKKIALTGTAQKIYDMAKAGHTAVFDTKITLRHTKTVRNKSALRTSLTNVGKIITPASIVTDAGIPSDVLFVMPTDADPAGSDFRYGWLKAHPTVTRTSFGRFQIVQEWKYDLWVTVYYAVV